MSQEPRPGRARVLGPERDGGPPAVRLVVARGVGAQIFVGAETVNGDIFLLRKDVKMFLPKSSSALCYKNVKCHA